MAIGGPMCLRRPNPLPAGWTLSNQALLSPSGRGPRRLSAVAYACCNVLAVPVLPHMQTTTLKSSPWDLNAYNKGHSVQCKLETESDETPFRGLRALPGEPAAPIWGRPDPQS